MSLTALLDDLPDGPAVFVGDEVVSRADLATQADAVASSLVGIAPGSPVAVRLPNGARLVATLFGVLFHVTRAWKYLGRALRRLLRRRDP